jgi:hypothetical protein
LPTIQRFETVDEIPPSRASTFFDVKAALAAAPVVRNVILSFLAIEWTGSLEQLSAALSRLA